MLLDLVRIPPRTRLFPPAPFATPFRTGLLSAGLLRSAQSLYAHHSERPANSATIIQIFDGLMQARDKKSSIVARPGNTLLVTPSHPLSIGLKIGKNWSGFYLTVTGNDALHFANLITTQSGRNLTLDQAAVDSLARCCLDAISLPEHSTPGAKSAIAYRAMAALVDAVLLPQMTPLDQADQWLSDCISFIEDNLASKIDVATLAGRAGLSRAHFVRAFTKHMRCPPSAFVQNRQMENAATLLLETDQSIGTIASLCGHHDANSFSKIFTRHFSKSPREFRTATRYVQRLAAANPAAPLKN